MKLYELAKELGMGSKELVEKVQAMGIDAKSHMSNLSDIDATAVRNTVLRGKSGAETKIVQVAPKKTDKGQDAEEPRVTVKAAKIVSTPQKSTAKITQEKPQERTAAQRPPVGKPVIPQDVENRKKPPVGKPIASKDLEEREITPKEPAAPKEMPQEPAAPKEAPKETAAPQETTTEQETTAPKETAAKTGVKMVQEFKIIEKASEKKAAEEKAADTPAAGKEPDAKPRRSESGRPQTREGQARDGSRPPRKDGDRPPRKDGDRPPRKDGDRPPRKDGDRPPRKDGERPPKRDQGAKPAGRDQGAKPPARDQGAKPSGKERTNETMASKPAHKKDDHTKGKERDKFSKLERGPQKGGKPQAPRSLEKKTRAKKQSKPKIAPAPELEAAPLPAGTKVVNVPITVAGLAEQIQVTVSQIIMTLMKLGVMANVNQNVDEDTVLLLAEELHVNLVIGKVEEELVEEGLETFEDKEEDLQARPPIITVMGHVDHGKTSLLDAIRKTNVTASESGGITQHIGASEVEINGQKIVFLDTPGHEAFTAMRARGAHTTDIAVLVIAADDSVKPQTIESISHAKAAGVPMIVAINKMDKPGANPDMVKKDLSEQGILVEDWGGKVIAVPVSAKTGEGIVTLLEMILLQAEVLELKANPNRLAMGNVLEARLDKAKGPVASLLVLNGTLKPGMSIVAGTSSGKIRLMTNDKGESIKTAGPATAVEILGLTEVPYAGDTFSAVKEDKMAREIADHRQQKQREEVLARNASTTLEELFSQIQEGEVKELNLIIKGDVQGSVGAIVTSLEKLTNENVRVKIVHTGVGAITESDVMLAGTSGSVIIGFNVRPSIAVAALADRDNIQIRTYRVIYHIIDDVENAMKGMLDPEFKEVVLGTVEIRETFRVPGIGVVGGAYVTDGKVVRNGAIRLVRDGIVIHEGKIASLKRFKDDAREVAQGYECGIGLENYNDIKEGDMIECFQMEEIQRD